MADAVALLETLMAPADVSRACGGLSESTLRRLVRAGTFPRPVVLSRTRSGHPCRVAWPASDVASWIAARIAEGRQERAAA